MIYFIIVYLVLAVISLFFFGRILYEEADNNMKSLEPKNLIIYNREPRTCYVGFLWFVMITVFWPAAPYILSRGIIGICRAHLRSIR